MLSLTIEEALQRKEEVPGHPLYLYRQENIPIYVGKSLRPFKRLREHLKEPDSFSYQFERCSPTSLKWVIDLLTLEECEPAIMEYTHYDYKWYWQLKVRDTDQARRISMAEWALIRAYMPRCNRIGNGQRTEMLAALSKSREVQPVDLEHNAVDYLSDLA